MRQTKLFIFHTGAFEEYRVGVFGIQLYDRTGSISYLVVYGNCLNSVSTLPIMRLKSCHLQRR